MPGSKKAKLEPPCIRCSDEHAISVCPAGGKKPNLANCSAQATFTSTLWPGFSEIDNGLADAVTTSDASKELLKSVFTKNKSLTSDAIINNSDDESAQLAEVIQGRSKMTVGKKSDEKLVNKAALQKAYDILYPHGAKDPIVPAAVSEQNPPVKPAADVEDIDQGVQQLSIMENEDVSTPVVTLPVVTPPTLSRFAQETVVLSLPAKKSIDKISKFTQLDAKHDARKTFDTNQSTSKASPQTAQFPLRKLFVKGSGEHEVYTNHFSISLSSGIAATLYEYTISSDSSEWSNGNKNKKKVLVRSLIDNCTELHSNFDFLATDYSTKIIGAMDLLNGQDEVSVAVHSYRRGTRDAPSVVTLTIRKNREISLQQLEDYASCQDMTYEETGATEALNIIVAKAISDGSKACFQSGNNKFYFREGWHDLGREKQDEIAHPSGLIAVRGYSCSVRPVMGTIALNIDNLTGAFYRPQSVHQYLNYFGHDFSPNSRSLKGADQWLARLRAYVNFSRIQAYPDSADIDDNKRRVKTIHGVDTYANQVRFERGKNDDMKVSDHIKKTYPALDMGGDQLAVNVGNKAPNQKYYMSGHLHIIGDQPFRGKLPSEVVANMITVARRRPEANRSAILGEGLKQLDVHASPLLASLGIKINQSMMSVPAHCIKAPRVTYGRNPADPDRPVDEDPGASGKWSTARKHFFDVKTKFGDPEVAFFCLADKCGLGPGAGFRKYAIGEFIKFHGENGVQRLSLMKCIETGKDYHEFPDTLQAWNTQTTPGTLRSKLEEAKKAGMGLAVLVLPAKDAACAAKYAMFKVICDQYMGITSVVLCEATMVGSLPKMFQNSLDQVPAGKMGGYMSNIAMKLNLRLGNTNHMLHDSYLPRVKSAGKDVDCMILGADVTHPGGASHRFAPSVAAVVGSIDTNFTKYAGSMRHQTRRQEQIDDMRGMVKDCAIRWYTGVGDHKRLPARILLYRDGVSEDYYSTIRKKEVEQIRQGVEDAYKELKRNDIMLKPTKVKITAVLVIKRHHTRFYPKGPEKVTESGNCLPGTVVDSSVTSPYYFDFFLQSHDPLEGTARPTHYFVLDNEMAFTEEELQNLTNNICYLYGRSSNSVSYATPAYYADRLCERGRVYLRRVYGSDPELKDKTQEEINQLVAGDWLPVERGTKTNGKPWHKSLNERMFWM